MKTFDYIRPASVEEACAALADADGTVKALAGGTDLLVQMKQGRLQPKALVSLRDVPGLSFIRLESDGSLALGAATPLGMVENSPEVMRSFPAIAEAASWIGSVQVRSRATVGGNLCNAAPSADMAPVLIAYGAEATISDGRAEHTVLLEDFFAGPGQTVLKPGELLKAITVPPAPAGSFGTYKKAYRSAMDIATVGVALLAVFAPGPAPGAALVKDARLVLGAVAPTPIRAREAERMLTGQKLEQNLIVEVSRKAAHEARPITDLRASAEYRTTLVEVLSRRALRAAHSWIEEGGRG
ncbi:MAG: xanthine dehydrogenase family protein subunit M [bacterium]